MEMNESVAVLSALAQESRLAVFRALVQRGPEGLLAGEIAAQCGVPASTLSFHLAHLLKAGLVSRERRGRTLVYAARFDTMNGLIGYLTENCCGGGVAAESAAACVAEPAAACAPAGCASTDDAPALPARLSVAPVAGRSRRRAK